MLSLIVIMPVSGEVCILAECMSRVRYVSRMFMSVGLSGSFADRLEPNSFVKVSSECVRDVVVSAEDSSFSRIDLEAA